jgi:hypothetical protein
MKKNRKLKRSKRIARPSIPALAQVCASPNEYLGKLDIATLNLMCAGGLPHATRDVSHFLDWIERAAHKVAFETRRHWYRFGQSPETYRYSPGYFCCYFLLQTLQEDFGVRYNPARVTDTSFQDPKCLNPDGMPPFSVPGVMRAVHYPLFLR